MIRKLTVSKYSIAELQADSASSPRESSSGRSAIKINGNDEASPSNDGRNSRQDTILSFSVHLFSIIRQSVEPFIRVSH